jgi:[Skp1-protein]-hydroxyproline N-acetylglucosaminyltransferase
MRPTLPITSTPLPSWLNLSTSSSTKQQRSILNNIVFTGLSILLGLTLFASILLGVFTIWMADDTANNNGSTAVTGNSISYKLFLSMSNKISAAMVHSNFHTNVVPKRLMELHSRNVDVPYFPPFAVIENGEQLAADVVSDSSTTSEPPTIAGIVYILQMFLRELRQTNKVLQNCSNDRVGQDIVRHNYFNIAQKHLSKFEDKYRGTTIFPVRDDETIFISLAAFREHLLYDTLAGAYSNAKQPNKLYVGIVMQNCFGIDDVTNEQYGCKTGAQVIGKDAKGHDMTKVSDAPPDVNGIEKFCHIQSKFKKFCDNNQIRVLSVHESESLGPAVARYYASKLWGGENYYLQADSHLRFSMNWDDNYRTELKATKNYPMSVLSMYPPGFAGTTSTNDDDESNTNNGFIVSSGTRLCSCEFSENGVEDHIIRINNGHSYTAGVDYKYPLQIPFIAAGFFFTNGNFLKYVPFDPYLPWAFMGEEIALSMRAWTSGYNIYAPRKNWIAHQYRPGRMGLPKFWGSVGRTYKRGIGFSNQLQSQIINRVKNLVGYPDITQQSLQKIKLDDVLTEIQYYGLGTNRTRDEYIKLTGIDFHNLKCTPMKWCNQGTLD